MTKPDEVPGIGTELPAAERRARPEAIKAVPVRHPGRWIAIVVLAVLTAMFVHMLVTNQRFQWTFMVKNMFTAPVLQGVRATVIVTVVAMALGILLGVGIAVARLSANPILRGAAWVYTWFFRAVPRLVLLLVFGNLGILYKRYSFGIPFDQQIAKLLGLHFNGQFFGFDANEWISGLVAGAIGLLLSEAAYMAEIVRAGIQSVDDGQTEAAQALGMRRGKVLRRIVLPQAMRVIVPPTGNEVIAMVKDTSLLAYVPAADLLFQLEATGNRTFQIFPMYVAACLWYLAICSVLMVGQYFLERRFARGHNTSRNRIRLRTRTAAAGGTGTGEGVI
jgi:polar amino acid transport system permease protein